MSSTAMRRDEGRGATWTTCHPHVLHRLVHRHRRAAEPLEQARPNRRALAVRPCSRLGGPEKERNGVLQGVVAEPSLKSAGEEVGGVEKRRQALARFQG